MAAVRFFERPSGRFARATLGTVLIALGIGLSAGFGGTWWVLAVVGVVPLLAASFDVCLLGPVFHAVARFGEEAGNGR